ncbi:hypothetical protein NQ317_006967 [Molorchus minor]|uniref:Uncharacterized protein n=1 Tax=Molorchus minor TaxID=1323400 RepID=A0ABQ9JKU9_9CUCU|nr:hypothetical protein NQ317_006967 [Molorchus minor]
MLKNCGKLFKMRGKGWWKTKNYSQNLIESMPMRLDAVLEVQCPQNKTSSYFLTGLKDPHLYQKGDNKSVFDVPPDYLNERYKPSGLEIINRIGEDVRGKIPVKPLSAPPSLDEILELDRNDNFSLSFPNTPTSLRSY